MSVGRRDGCTVEESQSDECMTQHYDTSVEELVWWNIQCAVAKRLRKVKNGEERKKKRREERSCGGNLYCRGEELVEAQKWRAPIGRKAQWGACPLCVREIWGSGVQRHCSLVALISAFFDRETHGFF